MLKIKYGKTQLRIKGSSLVSPLIQLAWTHNKTSLKPFGLEKQSCYGGREQQGGPTQRSQSIEGCRGHGPPPRFHPQGLGLHLWVGFSLRVGRGLGL